MTSSEPHPQTGQPIGLPVTNATPAPRPGPGMLLGRYGRIEKLKIEHAADLWNVFAGQDQVWTYIATTGPFAAFDEFSAFIAMRAAADDPYAYAIIDSSNRAVGYFNLMRIVPNHRVIEVGGVLYSPALQRTQLGTEAQYLLARYVFETLGYRRYEWKCDSHNAASRRAALRYGFSYEGTFRQHVIAKGRNRHDVWFSMLDSEWPSRKANFERWLAPENFDGKGHQKSSLAALNGANSTPEFAVTSESERHPKTGQLIGLSIANPASGPRPGPVTLKGHYGRVEKLKAEHAAELWEVFADQDQVWTYISSDGPFSNFPEFSAFIAKRAAAEDPYAYAIVDASERAIGYLTLLRIVPQHRVIEVGHVLYSPALQRTPLGTEAQYLLARYVFETLGYRRYEWKCDALNAASRRAALRYGFVYEGTFRQFMINKEGRNRDNAWFSMLDGEWPQRKRNFERWLAPDNFDGDGRQKISLAALNGQQA
jgi:RimJ/RimL family protein N-acetyltransferase